MEIEKLLENIGQRHLLLLNENGYIPGGHNGPYYDKETPVRNTAHWSTIFAFLYRKTNKSEYLAAVEKCADYLMSEAARPMQASYFCRTNVNKDLSNGTIGQAWAIEGLVSAYKVTNNKAYIETAREVFLLHPFDERYKLWKVVNVDGSIRQFDMTFNHQLWLAASGTVLLAELPDAEIKSQCQMFFVN
jgi:rhamnogalacturonyl hydrolase YesR